MTQAIYSSRCFVKNGNYSEIWCAIRLNQLDSYAIILDERCGPIAARAGANITIERLGHEKDDPHSKILPPLSGDTCSVRCHSGMDCHEFSRTQYAYEVKENNGALCK